MPVLSERARVWKEGVLWEYRVDSAYVRWTGACRTWAEAYAQVCEIFNESESPG